jgi:hypothetical protein
MAVLRPIKLAQATKEQGMTVNGLAIVKRLNGKKLKKVPEDIPSGLFQMQSLSLHFQMLTRPSKFLLHPRCRLRDC